MKNFGRLLRFAWPYRVRFGLSIVCAMLVALFWGANLGAVYPLLQILFRSENTQHWIAEKVESSATEVGCYQARLDELQFLSRLDNFRDPRLQPRMKELVAAREHEQEVVRKLKAEIVEHVAEGEARTLMPPELVVSEAQARSLRLCEARIDEVSKAVTATQNGQTDYLDRRIKTMTEERDKAEWWRGIYQRAQPVINRYLPKNGFETLLLLIALVMVGEVVKGLFMFLQEVLVADMTQLTLFDIRNHFYRRTMALDLSSFNAQGSSELIARFTNDMESLNQGISTVLGRIIREPLRIVSCLGVALWMNWRLTLMALVLVPVSAATTYRAGKIMKRAVRRSLESMSNIYKILQESFNGVKVVKAFTMERYERRRFFQETKSLYKKSIKVAKIDALSDPVLEILALTTVSIALLSGSYLVLNHTMFLNLGLFKIQLAARPMAIEDLLTFYTMLAGISDPVRKLSNVHAKLQRAAAASDRICAMMDREPTIVSIPKAPRLPRHQRTIEFDNVVFGYDGRETVIRELSLTVRHGETVALVGPNGCGKSTLMNLLPRFWDAQAGTIRIDGHDIREVNLRSLRRQIGVVLQETILFNDTVANNLAYGNRHMDRGAIVAAAKRAYAHSFIMGLPEGYDTMLGEGGIGLSGGQRQRLAIARAMLQDPAILILDEATSAVDIQDEALIRKAIEEFVRGRTTFLITHSLGTLQIADRIILMNEGRIEAIGTERELRASSSLYRKLHEIHFHRESA